jgi:hypothetical protein
MTERENARKLNDGTKRYCQHEQTKNKSKAAESKNAPASATALRGASMPATVNTAAVTPPPKEETIKSIGRMIQDPCS